MNLIPSWVKYAITAVLIVVVATFAACVMHTSDAKKEGDKALLAANSQIETASDVRTVETEVAKTHSTAVVVNTAKKQKEDHALQAAAEAHPTWASEPLPSDVLSVLQDGN